MKKKNLPLGIFMACISLTIQQDVDLHWIFFYLKIVDLKSLIHMDGLLFSKMLFCLNY